jgi:protein gp37
MAENTAIEWCDHTFNPWIGCTKVSPGCDHCYAEAKMDTRLHRVHWGAGQPRVRTKTWRDPQRWNDAHAEFFAAHGRRQRVFCASLADVFDNEVPAEWRADLATLILSTPNLDWLLLTKRIGNAAAMLAEMFLDGVPPNVAVGATMVDQEEMDRDGPKLMRVPASTLFVSLEPLLANINLLPVLLKPGVDWVIVGGESGPGARPMHPDWARSLRDQCAAAGVPFLFKQWGEFAGADQAACGEDACYEHSKTGGWVEPDGTASWGEIANPKHAQAAHVFKVGKKLAGRLLDGIEHNG